MTSSSQIQDMSFSSELQAVIWAFQYYSSTSINFFADSAYICGVMHRIEPALYTLVKNIFCIYFTLQCVI